MLRVCCLKGCVEKASGERSSGTLAAEMWCLGELHAARMAQGGSDVLNICRAPGQWVGDLKNKTPNTESKT